jgi:hypothetical protein
VVMVVLVVVVRYAAVMVVAVVHYCNTYCNTHHVTPLTAVVHW